MITETGRTIIWPCQFPKLNKHFVLPGGCILFLWQNKRRITLISGYTVLYLLHLLEWYQFVLSDEDCFISVIQLSAQTQHFSSNVVIIITTGNINLYQLNEDGGSLLKLQSRRRKGNSQRQQWLFMATII